MNKKIKAIAVIGLAFAGYNASAQLTKGSILGSCSVGYTGTGTSYSYNSSGGASLGSDSVPTPNGKTSYVTIGLNAGYFIMDNLVVGLSVSYSNTTTLENVEGYNGVYYSWNDVSTSIAPGVFATKYIPVADKFYITASFAGSYNSGKITNSYLYDNSSGITSPFVQPFTTQSTSGYNIVLTPGLAYFPSPNWAISFKLNNLVNYASSTVKNAPSEYDIYNNPSAEITENHTANTLSVAVGLVPTLGISYVFTKKSE